MENFEVYVPRDKNVLRQKKPHISVTTQKNGRTRISLYAVVRDWLGFSNSGRAEEEYVELLINHDTRSLLIRPLSLADSWSPSAIAVKGSSSKYLSIPGFTYDFPIVPGKYVAELEQEFDGERVVVIRNIANRKLVN